MSACQLAHRQQAFHILLSYLISSQLHVCIASVRRANEGMSVCVDAWLQAL